MRILVDGIACPLSIQEICRKVALNRGIPIHIIYDRPSVNWTDDSIPVEVDDDLYEPKNHKIINLVHIQDIVVTYDDYLASLIYQKVLVVIHPDAMVYNSRNVDQKLYERYVNRKYLTVSKSRQLKKRTTHDDEAFEDLLMQLTMKVEGVL